MINFVRLAGFLFLAIIVANIVSASYGNELFSDLDSRKRLEQIGNDPDRFRLSVLTGVLEHLAIIALAATLYRALGAYNQTLGLVWVVARSLEGLILLYNEFKYWSLLDLARRFSVSSGVSQDDLIEVGRVVLQSKNSLFLVASIFFGIGTIAYSYLFLSHGLLPRTICWAGLVFGLLYGAGNGVRLFFPNFVLVPSVSGLGILLFELSLGLWLLFKSNIP